MITPIARFSRVCDRNPGKSSGIRPRLKSYVHDSRVACGLALFFVVVCVHITFNQKCTKSKTFAL